MGQLFVNNLTLTLSEDVVTNQPTLSVVSSTGLPTFQIGDWLYLTLTDIREGGELRWEIVKVTSWTGTTLTVVRGQDGTAAQAWLAGAKASLRVTAADMTELEAAVTPAQLLTAIKTVDGPGSGLDADMLDGNDSTYYRQSFAPVVRAGTWSRVALFTTHNYFGSVKVSIHHVRNAVVVGAVLQITFGHSGHGQITQLGSHGYNSQIQVRLSASGSNDDNVYLEILDSGSAGDHTYMLYLDDICCGVTPYTTFTDGTSSTSILSLITTANNEIIVDGQKVWHQGNDGSGSGLDADTVDGLHIGQSGTNYIPYVDANGVQLSSGVSFNSASYVITDRSVKWVRIGTLATTVGFIDLHITIRSHWSEETAHIQIGTNYFHERSAITVQRQSYLPRLLRIAVASGNEGGIRHVYAQILATDTDVSVYSANTGSSQAFRTICDDFGAPFGSIAEVVLPASGKSSISNKTQVFSDNVLIGTTTDNGVDRLQVDGSIQCSEGIKNSSSVLSATGTILRKDSACHTKIQFYTNLAAVNRLTLVISGVNNVYASVLAQVNYFNLFSDANQTASRLYILNRLAFTSNSGTFTEIGGGQGSEMSLLSTDTSVAGQQTYVFSIPAGAYPFVIFDINVHPYLSSGFSVSGSFSTV